MSVFKLPDLGEGLPDAEISKWHVKEGQSINTDDLLVSMETAKAIVDVPSPFSGKIKKLYGIEGDIIKTGAPLVELEVSQDNFESEEKKDGGTVVGEIKEGNSIITNIPKVGNKLKSDKPKATPAIRLLAKELGVDLENIIPTGPNSTILAKDVRLLAESKNKTQYNSSQYNTIQENLKAPNGYEKLKGPRRAMCLAMQKSFEEVVHVTIYDNANLLKYSDKFDITSRLVQAICIACKKESSLNAYFDTQSMSIKIMDDVNLGLAIDTEDGLFVPVLKSAQNLNLIDIRNNVNKFKNDVKNREVSSENLKGATITLSNFGKFAGKYATPVIVPPQVAILACGKIYDDYVVIDDKPQILKVLPLSLSFDHRSVTGGEASRFLKFVLEALES